jgi:hypothetical protein
VKLDPTGTDKEGASITVHIYIYVYNVYWGIWGI